MDTTTYPPKTGAALAAPFPDILHVGDMIARRLDETGMTKAELGRRLGTSRQNINSLIRRRMPPIELIWHASKALQHDFFAEISRHLQTGDARHVQPPDVQALSASLVRAAMAVVNCAIDLDPMQYGNPSHTKQQHHG